MVVLTFGEPGALAPEVERHAMHRHGARTPANLRQRFDQDNGAIAANQPASGRDPGRATSYDCNIYHVPAVTPTGRSTPGS